ncbi:alcohol dehydrogenase catalytic domain-containing protein [Aeromicrobium sp. 50.2.37]|uniref:alcohol dehydrogenase catalytic domain-containing protein n=1 Tax=Aeromicrobium sp. 50.2.37 TaxID=2969305 RepID=UPI00214FB287|nr:alcohol dehydrogenase catalytic domain-containing protein [Aeromicrobium sp. 50.2.37]MCR4514061.1 alcohol dehydrogenase catalytic domain-containing protein [Aeromicrobium sp. 50.2.37]
MKVRAAVLERLGSSRPFTRSAPLTVSELDLEPPRGREVLVRIEAAGICHSDLSVVDGNRPRPVPMLLGHEACGRVEATGPDAGDWPVGQRVVMTFLPRCGECAGCLTDGVRPCLVGSRSNEVGELIGGGSRLRREGSPVAHHLGVSGFASHAVVDERSLVAVDDDVPPGVAAVLGCAVLTGGGAVLNAGRPRPGETVAVVGLGGVGMAAVLTALALDGVRVVGIDPAADKLDQARALGHVEGLTPAEAEAQALEADVVVEAAGNVRAFETAVAVTGPGGRTVTVGLPAAGAMAQVSPLRLVAGGRSIIGSYLGSAVPSRDIPVFVDLWRQGRLPVERLISSTIALDDVNQGMDDLADGRALRQIVDLRTGC